MDTAKFFDPNDFAGNDIEKINGAIAAAHAAGGRIIIPPRRPDDFSQRDFWLIDSAILLPENTTLWLDNCRIKLSDNCRDNMIRSANCSMGIEKVFPLSNICIYGIGNAVLEGADNPRATGDSAKKLGVEHRESYGSDAGKTTENQFGDWRNIGILMVNVANFAIENLSIVDSHCWAVSLEYCKHGKIKNLHFRSTGHKIIGDKKVPILNQDGLDLRRGCSDIEISGISGFTGDDLVALTAISTQTRPAGIPEKTEFCGMRENMMENHTHHIRIRNITGFSAGGHHIVRLLNASGIKLHDIELKNLLDTSPAGFHCRAAVKIGDRNPAWGGVTPLGDTGEVTLHNIVSQAMNAIVIAGSLKNSQISQVVNLNPEGSTMIFASGKENVDNVQFSASVENKF